MKTSYISYILLVFILLSFPACSKKDKQEPEELMEVTGIVTGYDKDVMYLEVLRTQMVHPLRMTEQTQMDIFAAPKDTVLLVYTGYLGYTVKLPVVREVHTRPYKETGSKVVNLKDLQNSGELITRP